MSDLMATMSALRKRLGDDCEVYVRSTSCGSGVEVRADFYDGSSASYSKKYPFGGQAFRVMDFVRNACKARDSKKTVAEGCL